MIRPATFEDATVVVDTNIISLMMSDQPADRLIASRYRRHLNGQRPAISFQTWAELLVGATAYQWDPVQLLGILDRFMLVPFVDELIGLHVNLRLGALDRNRRHKGRKIAPADAGIAATAWWLDAPLVTHDAALVGIPEIEVITELGD